MRPSHAMEKATGATCKEQLNYSQVYSLTLTTVTRHRRRMLFPLCNV